MNPQIKLVIGLLGKKNSGKDTAFEYLRDAIRVQTTLQVYRQAFADELKNEVAALVGGSVEVINRNKNVPEIRQLLQNYGSRRRVESKDTCWIEAAARSLPHYETPCVVIFTDVRHVNEAQWIKRECSGVLIRIHRSETDSIDDTHESETQVNRISYDYSIKNDWTLRRLQIMCKDLVTELRMKGILPSK